MEDCKIINVDCPLHSYVYQIENTEENRKIVEEVIEEFNKFIGLEWKNGIGTYSFGGKPREDKFCCCNKIKDICKTVIMDDFIG